MSALPDSAVALSASAPPWAAGQAALPLRKRLYLRFARARRWEFWPAWLFYLPIVCWILALGLRYRAPTVFTAANPLLDSGGLVGERKHQALAPLQANAPHWVAPFVLLDAGRPEARVRAALDFVAAGAAWPLVLKPDIGQRGRGVFIARNADAVRDYLRRFDGAVIAQRYVEGEEFGIFVARAPGEARPRVLSIVHKTFPFVRGDGERTLAQLILDDARAQLIAPLLLQRWAAERERVPAAGETVRLVEIGAHCRGSCFLDARQLETPALVDSLARLLDAVPGYAFGRIDLRVPGGIDALQRGEGLQVLELNGVGAESAHIYQPGFALPAAYRAMFRQWSCAFAIGAAQARRGAAVTGAFDLLRRFREDLRRGPQWF
jgi:hypothetical protein